MAGSTLARRTGLVAVTGGALYIVRGILSPLNPGRFDVFDSPIDYVGYAILSVALLLSIVVLAGLLLQQVAGQGLLT